MGIFPGIQRAWMTIDHILFLWDYTDPRGSFYQYDGLDQARTPWPQPPSPRPVAHARRAGTRRVTWGGGRRRDSSLPPVPAAERRCWSPLHRRAQAIIHAALVRPRLREFSQEEGATPDWLLLLSTPLEVVVLALYCTGAPGRRNASIEIHETGFSVPSDGVNMIQIEGSPTGRVFMSGCASQPRSHHHRCWPTAWPCPRAHSSAAPPPRNPALTRLRTPRGAARSDGFLYELQYGTVNGWWDTYRTCAKRNCSRRTDRAWNFVKSAVVECADPIMDLLIDAERNLLYTLSQVTLPPPHRSTAAPPPFTPTSLHRSH